MPTQMNPYDDGWRLEPRVWVTDGTTGNEEPRPAQADDYGRVDFDNDEGATVFTAWVQKTEAGYILRVDEHQDVELAIETSSDRQVREAAMMRLDAGLRVIAAEHPSVCFEDDCEPEAFGICNFRFTPMERGDRRRFLITEEYVGTDWSDHDRIPNTWTWETGQYSEASGQWEVAAEGECGPDTIEQLLDQARAWASEIPAPSPAPARSWLQAIVAPEQATKPIGPSY